MSDKADSKKGFTRRQILKGVPIGLAGAAIFSVVTGGVVSKFVRPNQMPNVPEDSIFAPDKNRYPHA